MRTAVFNVPDDEREQPFGVAYLPLSPEVLNELHAVLARIPRVTAHLAHPSIQFDLVGLGATFSEEEEFHGEDGGEVSSTSHAGVYEDVEVRGEEDHPSFVACHAGLYAVWHSHGYGESDLIRWERILVPATRAELEGLALRVFAMPEILTRLALHPHLQAVILSDRIVIYDGNEPGPEYVIRPPPAMRATVDPPATLTIADLTTLISSTQFSYSDSTGREVTLEISFDPDAGEDELVLMVREGLNWSLMEVCGVEDPSLLITRHRGVLTIATDLFSVSLTEAEAAPLPG